MSYESYNMTYIRPMLYCPYDMGHIIYRLQLNQSSLREDTSESKSSSEVQSKPKTCKT